MSFSLFCVWVGGRCLPGVCLEFVVGVGGEQVVGLPFEEFAVGEEFMDDDYHCCQKQPDVLMRKMR